MRRSLQSTLGLGLLLSLSFVFMALWLLVNDAIRVVSVHYIESRLEHDAESLLAAATISPTSDIWIVDRGKLNPNYNRAFSGYYYKIRVNKQTLLSRSLWDFELSDSNIETHGSDSVFLSGPQNQQLLVLARIYKKQGQSLRILVAENFSPIEREINSLQIKLAITAAIMLAVLLLIQIGLLRVSLRPLKKTSDELLLLERGEIKTLNNDVPKEITPMVSEINRLFAAMSQRLKRSRNAIGDLSHSLKRPLTVLQQLIVDSESFTDPESKKLFHTQISSINNIISRNLKRARLAGDGPGGANFIISKDLAELVNTIGLMYRHITVKLTHPQSSIDVLPYDRDDMLELLGNLIDNAAKWAKDIVQVDIVIQNKKSVSFTIIDDGPGIPDDKIAELLQRGSRLDETVEGQGIGLAIVHDIVLEYSGSLQFANAKSDQGLQVRIELPL